MELRDNENKIPANGDELPVTQPKPQTDTPPVSEIPATQPFEAACKDESAVAAGSDVLDTPPVMAPETPAQEIPSAGPARIQFHNGASENAALRGYGSAPGYGGVPYGYPGGPAGPCGYGGYPSKKQHRGRNIVLLTLAFVCSLALGGGLMFCAIYTGALTDAERFFRDTVREWYY